MELVGIVVGIVGLLAWFALAGVCFWKKRGLWVLGAVLVVPVAGFIVGLILLLAVPFEGDGGLGDLGLAVGLAFLVIAIAILSSFLVLAVGAIRPSARVKGSQYHTRWGEPAADDDPGGWEEGPDFDNLDAARRWARVRLGLRASAVKIYTDQPSGTELVETIKPRRRDP